MPKASDYRKAGRYSQQDKRANERRRAIETAEDAVGEARQARWEDPSAENFEAVRAAEAALYELDPTNHMFD